MGFREEDYRSEKIYTDWQLEEAKKGIPDLPHSTNCRDCAFFCKRDLYKSKRKQIYCDYLQQDLHYDVSGRYIKPGRGCPWKK